MPLAHEPSDDATVTASVPRPAKGDWRVAIRFAVHVVLVASLLGAVVVLLIFGLQDRNTIHVVVACVFFGLVLLHLAQRRHTVARLAAQLVGPRTRARRQRRMAISDIVLVLLAASVLASGIWDLADGIKHEIPWPPNVYLGYHTLASLLLLCYLIVHVLRRWRRFRRSTIR